MKLFSVSGIIMLMFLASCQSTTKRMELPPVKTVARVDLQRYLGTWYEIASFPQSFQKGCTGTSATYSLRRNGQINVVNRCRLGSLQGKEKIARGRARVADPQTRAKLKVSFFRPFWGDYWILELGKNYEYAVVGDGGRDYLWILSRKPRMNARLYQNILQRLSRQQFPIERLKKTQQAF